MKSSNNGLRGIMDVMLPPRQDRRDEQGNPIQSRVTGGTTRSDFRDQRTGRFHGGLDINYGGPKNSAGTRRSTARSRGRSSGTAKTTAPSSSATRTG